MAQFTVNTNPQRSRDELLSAWRIHSARRCASTWPATAKTMGIVVVAASPSTSRVHRPRR